MAKQQSWESCKYHLGNLERDVEAVAKANYKVRMLKMIFKESKIQQSLREAGIHKAYYCTHPLLLKLGVYLNSRVADEEGGYTPAALLFSLDLTEEDESIDWFGNDFYRLEQIISQGLRMCTHCRFYEKI